MRLRCAAAWSLLAVLLTALDGRAQAPDDSLDEERAGEATDEAPPTIRPSADSPDPSMTDVSTVSSLDRSTRSVRSGGAGREATTSEEATGDRCDDDPACQELEEYGRADWLPGNGFYRPLVTASPNAADFPASSFTFTQGSENGRVSLQGAIGGTAGPDSHVLTLSLSALDDDRDGTADAFQFESGFRGGLAASVGYAGVFGYDLQPQRHAILRSECQRAGINSSDCVHPSDLPDRALARYRRRVAEVPDQQPLLVRTVISVGYHRLEFRDSSDGYSEQVSEEPSVLVDAGLGWFAFPQGLLVIGAEFGRDVEAPKQRAICTDMTVDVSPVSFDCPLGVTSAHSEEWRVEPRFEVRGYLEPTFALALRLEGRFSTSRDLTFTPDEDESSFQFRHVDVQLAGYLATDEGVRVAIQPGLRFWGPNHDDDRDGSADSTVELVGSITLGAVLDVSRP